MWRSQCKSLSSLPITVFCYLLSLLMPNRPTLLHMCPCICSFICMKTVIGSVMPPSLCDLAQHVPLGFNISSKVSSITKMFQLPKPLSIPCPFVFEMSLRSFSRLALHLSSAAWLAPQVLGGTPPTCTNPQLSCQNTTAVTDTCCFNAPGGQLLQTQFWDTNPPTGPSDHWTVHGLWPDHCDGTYDAYCDNSRNYTNITQILQAAGKADLLTYMNTYWKDYQGNDEVFWEHEWGKHGTCISTLDPKCYTGYTPQQEVVDYFQKTVDLFKTLDSYSVSWSSLRAWSNLSQCASSSPLLGSSLPRPQPTLQMPS